MKYLIIYICFFSFLFSCSTSRINFDVEKPAEITLPSHIRSFGIMERARGGNYEVKEQAILGLSSTLNQNDRFLIKDTGIRSNGSGFSFLKDYSSPLDWNDVDQICSRNELDGLIALEYFDDDKNFRESQRERKKKTKSGADSTYIEFNAEQEIDLEIGWRIYDRQRKVIIDKYELRDRVREQQKGATQREARLALTSERELLKDICLELGREYARRITPHRINASRKIYKKGKSRKQTMEQAFRMADRGDFERSQKLWNDIIKSSADNKTKGRAAYNLGVSYELTGNFEKARFWAIKSYDVYGNKSAKSYIRTLNERQRDEDMLDRQYK